MSTSPADLLAAFQAQIRQGAGEGSPRSTRERVGHVFRVVSTDPADPWAMVDCPDGLGSDPDSVIAGERDHFATLGIPLEWKTYSYDEPADLGARLLRAGFTQGPDEALILGDLSALITPAQAPAGVAIREVRTHGDARRITEMYDVVWGEGWRSGPPLPDGVSDEDPLTDRDETEYALLAATADGLVVCAARVNLTPGTDFAGMWGGSTHPEWRRKGLFRALLAERARWALAHGATYARIDASPASEPILRSLGLHRVATTVPFTIE